MRANHTLIFEIVSWLHGFLSGQFGRKSLAILLTLSLTPCCAPAKAASPLSVHVQGNQLVDGNGNPLRLRGVNRSGSEYKCLDGTGIFDGPVDNTAIAAIKAWHINAVRVPLNEDCWLNINLSSPNPDAGAPYQSAIVAFVQALNNAGIYVILDLHWNAPGSSVANGQQPMADQDHAPAFWTGVAATFRNFPAVIFDLYNAPDVATWSCWLNGCTVSTPAGTWPTAGMAELVNTVRATGATQPIMLGGLSNATDLSQWLANMPADTLNPPQLVASVQSYCGTSVDTTVPQCLSALGSNQSAQWPTIAAAAKSVPVVTSELGEFDCATTYVTPYMTFADSIGLSYLGWAWDAYDCSTLPALISDYAGTPTNYGIGLKSHLAALNRLHGTHDFNGDGYSDIAWRDSSGNTAIWLMQGTAVLSSSGIGAVPTWSIVAQRDFNGDGMADLLWRDASGDTAIWFMNGPQVVSSASIGNIPNNWTVVGTGDFNGDGFGDILWQDASGNLAVWLMNGANVISSAGLGNVPLTFTLGGIGDFNGDGNADLLWLSSGGMSMWFMNGTQVVSSALVNDSLGLATASQPGEIFSIGDFDGDGKSDILILFNNNIAVWLMNGATISSYGGAGLIAASWLVAATGDYNGDGMSDILWRDTSGNTAIWFMNGTSVLSNLAVGSISNDWTVQSINSN